MAETTRTLGTSISPEYVKNWTLEMAIRELLQNLLDTENEFGCPISVRRKEIFAVLRDNGPGLELKHLALGISEKGETSIGQFGEGLKLALLVFARENRYIEVFSKDYSLVPVIKESEYGTPTLFFNLREGLKHIEGTLIKFRCTENELNAGKRYFPTKFNVKGSKVKWVVKDKISLPAGKVYVNGSLIMEFEEKEALFSYHLTGAEAKGLSNRDRTVVDQGKLRYAIKEEIIDKTSAKDMMPWLKRIFQVFLTQTEVGIQMLPSLEENLRPSFNYSDEEKEEVVALWSKVVGKRGVIATRDRKDVLAKRLGYEPIVLHSQTWEWRLTAYGIKTSEDIVKEKPLSEMADTIPEAELYDEERENLEMAKKLVTNYYADPGYIGVVDSLKDFVSSYSSCALGLYHSSDDKIFIVRDVLVSLEQACKVILHETVHRVTGAGDLSEQFQNAQDEISGKLLSLLKERRRQENC